MKVRTATVVALLCTIACPSLPQRSDREIHQREKELQKLRTEIQAYEKKIIESEKREQSTLDRLDDLEQQSDLIRKLIEEYQAEEARITEAIQSMRREIAELEHRVQFLQSHYATYVRSVYKHGRTYDLELIFSSRSINQLSIRIEYLRRFSEQHAHDLHGIVSNKDSLEEKGAMLERNLSRERKLLAEKTDEEKTLRKKYAERTGMLKKIRSNKKTYQKQLTRKTTAAHKIEGLIAELIEKERIRKEKEAAEKRERELAAARERERLKLAPLPTPKPANDALSASAFADRRGRLRWPVAGGSVKAHFGKQVHPVLKTVTQNTGIDIAIAQGSNVFAVADGEVSVVSFIPGFGNVIIINHFGGYRTVYAHLAEILVTESQIVHEGTIIARSGDTIEQPLVHFELWKEREKQDPETWLAEKR